MLVDAGFVGERVVPDDGLVALHDHTGHVRDEAAAAIDLRAVDIRLITAERILAHLEGHDDFFERRIARAFADAVDRALDLTRAILDRSE